MSEQNSGLSVSNQEHAHHEHKKTQVSSKETGCTPDLKRCTNAVAIVLQTRHPLLVSSSLLLPPTWSLKLHRKFVDGVTFRLARL